MKTIDEFAGKHSGEDIYVFGSGPSLNHIDPSFFENKVTVAANHGAMKVLDRVDYLVTKYHHHAQQYAQWWPDIPVVVTLHNTGNIHDHQPLPHIDSLIVAPHNHNTCDGWTPDQWPDYGLVATWSTITTAMHWAAHLGATNIVMVGHDLGHINEAGRVPNYRQEADGTTDDNGDSHMWQGFNEQSRLVKAELLARYDGLKNVISLLPFINANMEGHRWSSFAGTLNA